MIRQTCLISVSGSVQGCTCWSNGHVYGMVYTYIVFSNSTDTGCLFICCAFFWRSEIDILITPIVCFKLSIYTHIRRRYKPTASSNYYSSSSRRKDRKPFVLTKKKKESSKKVLLFV